jgi:hypothetical protein
MLPLNKSSVVAIIVYSAAVVANFSVYVETVAK